MKLPKQYMELEEAVVKARTSGSGIVVLGLPGMGVSYFLELLSERLKIPLVNELKILSGGWVIFNPDFLSNPQAIDWTNELYRRAGVKQKIILGVNAPAVLYREEMKSPHIVSRWYGEHWLRVRDGDDLKILIEELGINLTEEEMLLVLSKSGGNARLAKYLALNKDKLTKDAKTLWLDEEWKRLAGPFLEQVVKCRGEWLKKMHLLNENGKWVSEFLGEMVGLVERVLAVSVEGGLHLVEFGERNNVLLPFEVKVVEYLVKNQGVIGKDKIAEFRWGENSYDESSDQAIAKAMQRLGVKFKYHLLEPIPKIGYKLGGK